MAGYLNATANQLAFLLNATGAALGNQTMMQQAQVRAAWVGYP